MAPAVAYAARFDTDDLVARGRTTTLQCRTYRAGELATPTEGTVSVYDGDGTAVVDEEAVTVAGGVATFAVLGTLTADLDLSDDWRVAWTLTMPDASVQVFENLVHLCRHVPSPPVTEATVFGRAPSLDPSRPGSIAKRRDYTPELTDAWVTIQNLLLARGVRSELVVQPSQLREPMLLLALANIFENAANTLNSAAEYRETAAGYRAQFEARWKTTTFEYDPDDDGVPDGKQSAHGPTWLL